MKISLFWSFVATDWLRRGNFALNATWHAIRFSQTLHYAFWGRDLWQRTDNIEPRPRRVSFSIYLSDSAFLVWVPPLGFDPYCKGEWLLLQDEFTSSIISEKKCLQKL